MKKINPKTIKIIVATSIFYPLILIMFLPAKAQYPWQELLYHFITQRLGIVTGIQGDLPFFTVVVSFYWIMVILIGMIYPLSIFFKQHRNPYKFQSLYYHQIFRLKIRREKLKWIEGKLVFMHLFQWAAIAFGFSFTAFHLLIEDINQLAHYRGGLIALAYQYKLGIVILEFITHMFSMAAIIMLIGYFVYLGNILRGYGQGMQIYIEPQQAVQKQVLTSNQRKRQRRLKRR